MSDATNENGSTTSDTGAGKYDAWSSGDVQDMLKGLHLRLDRMENALVSAQRENTQTLRTVMVGWNAFLKSAEGQLRAVFKGNIPAPILKRLIQTAFKGIDEADRKGQ